MTKNFEISYLLDFYGPMLTEKQRDIAEMYYYEDLSLAEIAEATGITRQGVRDAIKRSEEVVTEMEEKVGFARWYSKTYKKLAQIEEDAQTIKRSNSSFLQNEVVGQAAADIIECVSELSPEKYSPGTDEDL